MRTSTMEPAGRSHPGASRRTGPAILGQAQAVLAYVGVVIGGLTLFLAVTPLFGYLAYGDRPGPGWYGRFPAMGWADFWAHAWQMALAGAFFAFLYVVPGAILVLLVRAWEAARGGTAAVRAVSTVLSALLAGHWALAAGWYVAGAPVLGVIALALGALGGAFVMPTSVPRARVKRLARVTLFLFALVPVQGVWEMGPEHAFAVRLHPAAEPEQVQRVWDVAGQDDHFRSGGLTGRENGGGVLVFSLHPRTSASARAAFARSLARLPGVASVRVLPRGR